MQQSQNTAMTDTFGQQKAAGGSGHSMTQSQLADRRGDSSSQPALSNYGAGGSTPMMNWMSPWESWGGLAAHMPSMPNIAADIVERDKDFLITADVPGIDKSNCKVSVEGDMLKISAERKQEKHDKKEGYYSRYERSYGNVQRMMRLPPNADPSKLTAKHNNGVLSISVPKTERAAGSAQDIRID
jgi:HSP20 family molecular chaperone IbpA